MNRITGLLFAIVSSLFAITSQSAQSSDLMGAPECKDRPALDSIKFNNEFFSDIESGKKVATTRIRIRCYQAGSTVKMLDQANTDKGAAQITKVSKLTFAQLTEDHAKKENCTLQELQEGLLEIYGPEVKTSDLSFVEFQIPPKR